MDEEGHDWDLLLPYVLFAIQKTPQVSTGFTPLGFCSARRPKGLLDMTKEAWEEQPSLCRSVMEFVQKR